MTPCTAEPSCWSTQPISCQPGSPTARGRAGVWQQATGNTGRGERSSDVVALLELLGGGAPHVPFVAVVSISSPCRWRASASKRSRASVECNGVPLRLVDWQHVRCPPAKPAPVPSPEQLRVLWRVERRKQFRCQIIIAAIYKHPHGQELRVFLGDETEDDLLHSEVAQFDSTPLDEKAADLRSVLLEKDHGSTVGSIDAVPSKLAQPNFRAWQKSCAARSTGVAPNDI
jgi:hypothetical protein